MVCFMTFVFSGQSQYLGMGEREGWWCHDRPCPGTQQEDPHEVGSDKGPQVVCLGFTPDASKFIAAAETTSLSTQM